VATIRELFPFGDLDDDVVTQAVERFPVLPASQLGAGFDIAKTIVDVIEHFASILEDSGLTPARWRLLVALAVQSDPSGATIGELAGHLGVREPTITATVDRLEREGLVERSRSTEDRRVVRVLLTPDGAITVETVIPRIADRIGRFVGSMGGPEEMRDLAGRMRTAIESSR
jgi:DNA-binding MarR family transcriptional regulator